MNKPYSLRYQQVGRLTGFTNSVLAVLLMAGLAQIALCFDATVGLLPPTAQIKSAVALPAYVTNGAIAHETNPANCEKS